MCYATFLSARDIDTFCWRTACEIVSSTVMTLEIVDVLNVRLSTASEHYLRGTFFFAFTLPRSFTAAVQLLYRVAQESKPLLVCQKLIQTSVNTASFLYSVF